MQNFNTFSKCLVSFETAALIQPHTEPISCITTIIIHSWIRDFQTVDKTQGNVTNMPLLLGVIAPKIIYISQKNPVSSLPLSVKRQTMKRQWWMKAMSLSEDLLEKHHLLFLLYLCIAAQNPGILSPIVIIKQLIKKDRIASWPKGAECHVLRIAFYISRWHTSYTFQILKFLKNENLMSTCLLGNRVHERWAAEFFNMESRSQRLLSLSLFI